MNDNPLPWLDLESARRKAGEIRKEKEAAITNLEERIKQASEKKRDYRKAEGVALAKAIAAGDGATVALRKARLETAQEELEAELAEGMVQVAKERLEQTKEDLWSLRHFSERSGAIEGWGGTG